MVTSLGKETGRIGNQKNNREHINLSIVKIGKNTQKSPEDLRRFVASERLPIKAGVENTQGVK